MYNNALIKRGMDMDALPVGQAQQPDKDRRRLPVVVPPAYPDPETWRRFGLFRRQLQHSAPLQQATTVAARQL